MHIKLYGCILSGLIAIAGPGSAFAGKGFDFDRDRDDRRGGHFGHDFDRGHDRDRGRDNDRGHHSRHDRHKDFDRRHGHSRNSHDKHFQRIATLPNYLNNEDIDEQTVSEIVAATSNGRILVYTDSPREAIGFVDIDDPRNPQPDGTLAMGGEPTSVVTLGNRLALVGVNTSESFTNPGGHLAVVDINQRTILAEIDLGGQPDSVAISSDERFVAVAIENERNEDICIGGSLNGQEVDEEDCVAGGGLLGVLPQTGVGNPPGYLAIVDINGSNPNNWGAPRIVSMTGLSAYAPEDPEPEYVDINDRNQAVVSMQENNHGVIVDLETGTILRDFDFGAVTLNEVDAIEDGLISLTDTVVDVPREPDAISWVPWDYREDAIATANEGDLFGGSRGFSILSSQGAVLFDSGNDFEHIAVRAGHYPESRSENKGSEPEAVEYGRFDGKDYLFVGSERGSFVAVYRLDRGKPRFQQVLPGPLGPEGVLAVPQRDLLIVSGEEDDPPFGVRSAIMIYELKRAGADYPQIVSVNENGAPIGFSALSGMVAMPGKHKELLAVWDSYYSQSNIFRIDASDHPARITEVTTIQGGSGDFDPEGIAIAPDRTLWVASEGNATGSRKNRLLQLDTLGTVMQEIELPAEIEACRASSTNTGSLGAGFEGVAILPVDDDGYKLLVAQQRGWDYTTPECEDLDDDAAGLLADGEPRLTRIWIYDPVAMNWDHLSWELASRPENAAWVGLSEITEVGDGSYLVIERDNLTGDFSELKTLVRVDAAESADGITAGEKEIYDLLPDLTDSNGWITDKPEGVAIDRRGKVYLVTDNDGVEDWSGETWFLELGDIDRLF